MAGFIEDIITGVVVAIVLAIIFFGALLIGAGIWIGYGIWG
jgi:hypothetical protein